MKILNSDLESAAQKGIITSEQAKQLWSYFQTLRPDQSRLQALHVLYYFGGVLILSSMSWFLTIAWSSGPTIMIISGVFAVLYYLAGKNLWHKEGLRIPGGLLITAAVSLTPVIVYGFQKSVGWWHDDEPGKYQEYHKYIQANWIFMEIATVVVAAVALKYYRFPFLTFPLAFSLWYMSMDLTPFLFGVGEMSFYQRQIVSLIFGAFVLVGSFLVDRQCKEQDFAFWTYLYGMLAFWGALSSMNSNSDIGKLGYCILNLGFIMCAVYLRRRVFLVFGSIGVMLYIGHLAWIVFKDSFALPIVLALLGLIFIYLGVKYQKNKESYERKVEEMFPTFLARWRPQERA